MTEEERAAAYRRQQERRLVNERLQQLRMAGSEVLRLALLRRTEALTGERGWSPERPFLDEIPEQEQIP